LPDLCFYVCSEFVLVIRRSLFVLLICDDYTICCDTLEPWSQTVLCRNTVMVGVKGTYQRK